MAVHVHAHTQTHTPVLKETSRELMCVQPWKVVEYRSIPKPMWDFAPLCPKDLENETAIGKQNKNNQPNSNWGSERGRDTWVGGHCGCKQNPEKSAQALFEQMGKPCKKIHIKMKHLNETQRGGCADKLPRSSSQPLSVCLSLRIQHAKDK